MGQSTFLIIFWDIPTGKRRHKLSGDTEEILCFKVHDNVLFFASHNGRVRLWDMNIGYCTRELKCHDERYVSRLDSMKTLLCSLQGLEEEISRYGILVKLGK